MKLIELHILQSFPVSCLNRDDVGAPKTAIFGGAMRARISSQCQKRAVREMTQELAPSLFAGNRSRLIVEPLRDAIAAKGVDAAKALDAAKAVGEYLATFDVEKEKTGKLMVKTLMFLSPAEMKAVAEKVATALNESASAAVEEPKSKKGKKEGGGLGKLVEKAIKEACKSVQLKDAADIAIFGRMVASDPSLTVEGAGMFSHALSTHKADTDLDFFAAVDDLQGAEEAGAGMTGTLEFNSACYYRYAALNLDLLFDADHLASLGQEERKQVVAAFIRATLLAVPVARKNSMNANTLPVYVLGLVKEKGQPIQLVNAFEKPVWSKNGLIEASVDLLKKQHESLKKTWGIEAVAEVSIPDKSLDDFCKVLVNHV
ncbi:MAG: type I-E CRISPR-associated protein Cas7/Cse4/CasC [Kiritimatiellia bacterium]|jgi:CRISPR system Cascade subunit CasC